MRILFIKDKEIPKRHFKKVVKDLEDIYKKHADIDIESYTEEWTMTDIPYEEYYDGYFGISRKWMKQITEMVDTYDTRSKNPIRKKFDHIVFCVHDRNFDPAHKEKGVWGWNMGWGIRGYEVEQVRFDPKKPTNSLATLYHEIHHSHKWFPMRTTGFNVEWVKDLDLRKPNWGDEVTHGNHPKWRYIGRHTGKENLESVELAAPILRQAYKRRRDNFEVGAGLSERAVQKFRALKVKLIAPKYEHN